MNTSSAPKVGDIAPTFFSITAYENGKFKKISSADFHKKWVTLFFYPRDFTFICPTEIKEFSRLADEFKHCKCEIVACSTDSEHSHKNWFERDLKDVKYPVLADTAQEVSRAYNVLASNGEAQRGVFIIDPEGVLRWMLVSDKSVGRSVKEIVRVLRALQTGDLCPVEWEPGKKTLGKK